MTSAFQLVVSGLINSITLVSACRKCLRETTSYVDVVGSHLSPQTRIFSPFLTLHRVPSLTSFLADMILLHVYDGLFPRDAWTKSHFGKYFALRTRYTNEFCPVWSYHPCFANKARLNSLSYLKPIPSNAFGSHIFSQLSQAIFLSSFFCLHWKFLIMLVNSSHREFGILKQLIV